MRRHPPLAALRVFEIAARTASYSDAAAELGLTHGAVSRQIAALETWLGQRLFVRVGRRMSPTPAARVFAAEVSLAFDRIGAAAEACGRPQSPRILRVSAPTTFALRWLIPKLEDFHRDHPGLEVAVTTVVTLQDELRGGFDVAIRRGSSDPTRWAHYHPTPFLDERDTLIAAPSLLEQLPLAKPNDIAGHILLASETRPGDWSDWLGCAGLSHDPDQRRRVFDHFFVTLQAVLDGLGLGIGPLPVLAGDVSAGRLSLPFPNLTVPRPGYVALVPFDADKSPGLDAFVAWLVARGRAEMSQA